MNGGTAGKSHFKLISHFHLFFLWGLDLDWKLPDSPLHENYEPECRFYSTEPIYFAPSTSN
jgi:hypothetical protein